MTTTTNGPSLIVGKINLNQSAITANILSVFKNYVKLPEHYRPLQVHRHSYFQIEHNLPEDTGWYVILTGGVPVYVGMAQNLNARLNSPNGSLDNFRNSKRMSDPERNLIKKLHTVDFFPSLNVWFLTAHELKDGIGLVENLNEIDVANVKKFLNLTRGMLGFETMPSGLK